jgi:D-lactate dehydrogenase
MAKITFLEVDGEDERGIIERYNDVKILSAPIQEKEVVQEYADCEILSCFIYSTCTEEILSSLPKLKLLVTRSVGTDHIDLEYCTQNGITVCNVPDYGSHVIAEHVFALLLGTVRHIHEGDEKVEKGSFDYHGLRGIALKGKTIGIVGTGKIGRHVARIAHGFEMNILATDIYQVKELEERFGLTYVEMDELLSRSDIITLHVPLMKKTEHMINTKSLAKAKDGIIIVNTARGSLIDSDALFKALTSGKVSYALLDVLEHEKNFEENKDLISHPNVVTTPHIGFYADDSMHTMYLDSFESIDAYLNGNVPIHHVHPLTSV